MGGFIGQYVSIIPVVYVWLNTPRRPWEASGTSGMKVLVNGGLNLSQLDGWWAEAYTPEVGWAIGDGLEHDDDPAWDAVEAEQLYEVLEREVVPEFYNRNADGIPTAWISRMRASMSQLTPQYSAVRTVREYAEQHYLPAAAAYCKRAEFNGSLGTSIVNWEHAVAEKWSSLEFGQVNVQSNDSQHTFEIHVTLDGLDPEFVKVQLYAEATPDHESVRTDMTRNESKDETESAWAIYRVSVPATRPTSDFTPRIVPYHSHVSVPLELNLIKWQR